MSPSKQNREAFPSLYVRLLALSIPASLIAIHLWTWIVVVPTLVPRRADFRQLYAAAYLVRTGRGAELYDYGAQKEIQDRFISPEQAALPFVGPAYEALLFAPLTLVSYKAAYWALLILNLAGLGACYVLLYPWTAHLRTALKWLPTLLVISFPPITETLIQGQDSILLTLILAGSFFSLSTGAEFLAGVLAATAFFKFPIVLPLFILFLIWKHWRFCSGFLISLTAAAIISVWVGGVSETRRYLHCLFSIAGIDFWDCGLAHYPVFWQLMPNVHGLVVGVFGRLEAKVQIGVTALVSGVVLMGTAISGMRGKQSSARLLLAIPSSVLVAYHSYIHDLSILIIPIMVLLDGSLSGDFDWKQASRWVAMGSAVLFVAPVLKSYFPTHFYLASLCILSFLIGMGSKPFAKILCHVRSVTRGRA
jgi:hypothetical protein